LSPVAQRYLFALEISLLLFTKRLILFFFVDEFACINRKVLDYTEFYEVRIEIAQDLKKQWKMWRRDKLEAIAAGEPDKPVGIFDFAFLAPSVVKAGFLRIESFTEMTVEMVDVCKVFAVKQIVDQLKVTNVEEIVFTTHFIVKVRNQPKIVLEWD